MDLLMAIGFFIMFLVILGVLVYLIYDYIKYKKEVDETVKMMKRRINRSNVQIQQGYNKNASILNNATSNISMNRQDIIDMDKGLGKIFQLTSNNKPINASIFDYIMNPDPSNTDYKMKLLKRVDAVSGMTIDIDNTVNKNFRICSNTACLNLQMEDNKFKISPSGTRGLEITAANAASPMANFDFDGNNIYLGGNSAASSVMSINEGGVTVDGSRFKFKGETTSLQQYNDDLATAMRTGKEKLNTALLAINDAVYSSYSNLEFIANYTLTNVEVTPNTTPKTYTNTINVAITPLYDMFVNSTDVILISIPSSEIGTWNTNWSPTFPNKTPGANIASIDRQDATGASPLQITFNTATLAKNTPITFSLSGVSMLSNGKSTQTSSPVTGIVIPRRANFPASLRATRTAIDNWFTVAPPLQSSGSAEFAQILTSVAQGIITLTPEEILEQLAKFDKLVTTIRSSSILNSAEQDYYSKAIENIAKSSLSPEEKLRRLLLFIAQESKLLQIFEGLQLVA